MPGKDDEDYDGVDTHKLRRLWRPFSKGEKEKIPEHLLGWRWNKFKWVLLCTTSMVREHEFDLRYVTLLSLTTGTIVLGYALFADFAHILPSDVV